MARMTHMTRRGAVYWFRFKLPADLHGKLVPANWPSSLASLVSPTHAPKRLEVELTRSLVTNDAKLAKYRCAIAILQAVRSLSDARCDMDGGLARE